MCTFVGVRKLLSPSNRVACFRLWTRRSRYMSVRLFSSTLCVLKVACATTRLTPASSSLSRSSRSSAAETRTSPCSTPWWSRSCCGNRAWQPLPRSWRNSKLSQEVFANQDSNPISGKKKKKQKWCWHFSTEIFWSETRFLFPCPSYLSFGKRPSKAWPQRWTVSRSNPPDWNVERLSLPKTTVTLDPSISATS